MSLGVPLRKASGSRFPLQLRALITGLAGFPLQSLTHRQIVCHLSKQLRKMPSIARTDLTKRLKDVDQLLGAHKALTQLRNARSALTKSGGTMASIAVAVSAMVTPPGKGRPAEVAALNRSAFVLLSSHMQGFVRDLHLEAAKSMLKGRATNVEAIAKLVTPRNANPHSDIIDQMFAGIGVYNLMAAIKWEKCSSQVVKSRLTQYIQERNSIAHGKAPSIAKSRVVQFKAYLQLLAEHMDEEVAKQVKKVTGTAPWT